MECHDLVVIGGSFGSFGVLQRILADLPRDLPAAVLITAHLGSGNNAGRLASALDDAGPLTVREAADGDPVRPGSVLLAGPGRHLLLDGDRVALGDGPREHMARPAINALFRSAALHRGPRAVGVLVSGLLDDGVAGLASIRRADGTTVAQEPWDAEADEMPAAAVRSGAVEHTAPAAALGGLIAQLVRRPAAAAPAHRAARDDDLALDVAIAAGRASLRRRSPAIAPLSALTSTRCSTPVAGTMGGNAARIPCEAGHASSADTLAEVEDDGLVEAVCIAMRVMDQRVELLERMASEARGLGRTGTADALDSRAAEYAVHARTLRRAARRSMRTDCGDPGRAEPMPLSMPDA